MGIWETVVRSGRNDIINVLCIYAYTYTYTYTPFSKNKIDLFVTLICCTQYIYKYIYQIIAWNLRNIDNFTSNILKY